MSAIDPICKAVFGILLLLCFSGCEEPVTRQGFHKHPAPLKKGNATIQMDAKLTSSGDVVVHVVSLADLSFVDVKTKVGEEWRDLARLQDLKPGEPQTVTVRGPLDGAQYLWATGHGADAKWVAQSRILASDDPPSSPVAAKVKTMSTSTPTEEDQLQKIKANFSGKKIME